jgi:energy-coupling factor transport system substrate-specific component
MHPLLPEPAADEALDPYDDLAHDLRRLRARAGAVSYTELAARITRARESRGITPAAAAVARSTVYDVFRVGRKRVNPDLIAEVISALGGTEAEAAELRLRAAGLRDIPNPGARSAPPATAMAFVVAALVACVFLNLFGHIAAGRLGLPLYLDMIGTAAAAFAFGPWAGAAVGLATNVLSAITDDGPVSMWFALVNVTGGLLWGFGFRRWGFNRGPLRFLLLTVIVAVACTLVAAPILVFAFGGFNAHPASALTSGLVELGDSLWGAVVSSNLATSLADKLIAGGIGVATYLLLTRYRLVSPVPVRVRSDLSKGRELGMRRR